MEGKSSTLGWCVTAKCEAEADDYKDYLDYV